MSVTTWEVVADHVFMTEKNVTIETAKEIEVKEEQEELEPQQMTETYDEPEPRAVKEERVEVLVFQEEGQLSVKQETSTSVVTSASEEIFHSGPELLQMVATKEEAESEPIKEEKPESVQIKLKQEDLCSGQEEDQPTVKQETHICTVIPPCEENYNTEPEPNQNQLLSANCPEAESEHQEGRNQKDLGSSGDNNLEPEKRHQHTKDHQDNVNSSKVKRHEAELSSCEVCGKCFTKRKYLTDHMRTHTGEKPYICTFCGKSFTNHSNRAKHLRTHTNEKPHPCDLCDKSFRQPNELARHFRTHTGEKPFSCLTCGKDFTQQSNLTVHMRSHTGEKPYSCNFCGNTFRYGGQLTIHVRTHTGEKPFSCQTCGRGFAKQSALAEHMRTHTGEKPYPCKLCEKSFRKSSALAYHTRTHMSEGP
ncbi:zinc finger protein OZF-like [Fundulus heteroclitus]|uniref:zinc finger protein OZF-like n=1 Tax=Fundulus heteroclitus TaxID=8078 RepID=UPI00165AFF7D|nr:zinc finger protein OZF-like [Fundulus heteroclitus]XP_035987840.1 zinc finger protein OZF-like [Fundulus heteroclitus]